MNKVLLAFGATTFTENTLEFIRQMKQHQPVFVTAVFLPVYSYADLWDYSHGFSAYNFVPMLEHEDQEAVDLNIRKFESLCKSYHLPCAIHKDVYDFALPQLKKETRFADLLVISSVHFYEGPDQKSRNKYLHDALHEAECPVVIVPEQTVYPENVVLAYDGSDASIHAIRQFAYLFPDLIEHDTLLVYASEGEGDIPYRPYIEELLARHFPKLKLFKPELDPEKYFDVWIRDRKNSILVCGSFGRSHISRLFKKSFAFQEILDQQIPVFSAHL